MAVHMDQFYHWYSDKGYYVVLKFPKEHNFDEMTTEQIHDFVDILRDDQALFRRGILKELPAFWEAVTVELLKRLKED